MLSDQVHGVGINVGSQTTYHGRGPIYPNGTFEFVPIPEEDDSVTAPTYGDLDLNTEIVKDHEDEVVHADPEFPELCGGEHYTYGDRHERKTRSLRKLGIGDYVFFFGTLDPVGTDPREYWINPDWGAYIFGHFELGWDPIVGKEEFESAPNHVRSYFSNNAHLRRADLDDNIVLILGDPSGSKLYRRPVPLSVPDPELSHRERYNDSIEDRGTNVQGEWYRGPLEFDKRITERFANAEKDYQFHRVVYPTINSLPEFDRFADEVGTPSTFTSLRDLFRNDWEDGVMTPEERFFATFSYISAGWTTTIPRRILETMSRPIDSPKEVCKEPEIRSLLAETFSAVRNESGWPHSHRWYYPTSAGHYRDKDAGESLEVGMANLYLETLNTFPFSTFEEFIQETQASANPFHTGFDSIRKAIESFGRTPAFDWMEVLVNVHGLDAFAPEQLDWDYIRGDNSKPEQGFRLVFGIESLDALDDPRNARKNEMLHRLVEYSKQAVGMGTADAIFAVESALCNCQKGVDDINPEDVDRSTEGAPPC